MDDATMAALEVRIRRTEALFAKGRVWMALMLGGSASLATVLALMLAAEALGLAAR